MIKKRGSSQSHSQNKMKGSESNEKLKGVAIVFLFGFCVAPHMN